MLPLYIHGLEGSPHGTKGRFMETRFGRSGPLMPASHQPDRAVKTPPQCFETCYSLIQNHLEAEPAPVLVGSSFGGAITLALLQRGAWRGPTVLLAPAALLYGLSPLIPLESHTIIIHDPQDDIVPYADSERIARENPGRVELWPTLGGHRLHSIVGEGILERAVMRQLEMSK